MDVNSADITSVLYLPYLSEKYPPKGPTNTSAKLFNPSANPVTVATPNVNKTKSKANNVEIYYLGAPKYKITAFSENYKTAERVLSSSVEKIEKSIRNKGKFAFTKNK